MVHRHRVALLIELDDDLGSAVFKVGKLSKLFNAITRALGLALTPGRRSWLGDAHCDYVLLAWISLSKRLGVLRGLFGLRLGCGWR